MALTEIRYERLEDDLVLWARPDWRDPMKNRRLYFEQPFVCAVREEPLPEAREGQLLVQTNCSAISAGTEMLVFQGRFPARMTLDATLPSYGRAAFRLPPGLRLQQRGDGGGGRAPGRPGLGRRARICLPAPPEPFRWPRPRS